jgi:acyl-CoA reductase-like NAD-dependent aldehyde dehydrogenase
VRVRARVHSPIDGKAIGRVSEADDAIAGAAMAAAESGFAGWGGHG